jgi:hypothetical protein
MALRTGIQSMQVVFPPKLKKGLKNSPKRKENEGPKGPQKMCEWIVELLVYLHTVICITSLVIDVS